MAEAGRQQCLVTGEALLEEQMLRLVLSPEAVVTPDVAQKLPGASPCAARWSITLWPLPSE